MAVCEEGTVCVEQDDGARQCLPTAGDCACQPHAESRCAEGNVVWFSSCDVAEDIAERCGDRGCLGRACCPEGTQFVGVTCVPDEAPDTAGGTDGGHDAGGTANEDTSGGSCGASPRPGRGSGATGVLLLLWLGALVVRRRR